MLKRLTALSLGVLLVGLQGFNPPRVSAQETESKSADRIRKKVAGIGTGPRAKVEVKLDGGTKIKGHISKIEDEHFTVVDKKAGEVTVRYAEVRSLKERYTPKWMRVYGYVALGALVPVIISAIVVTAQGGQ
jgi:hypothetical protein